MKKNLPNAIPHVAEVLRGGHIDTSKTGALTVRLLNNSKGYGEEITAHSLMPFGGLGHGIFGPTQSHSRVLVVPVYTDPFDEGKGVTWYWVGVIPTVDTVRGDKHEDTDESKPNIAWRGTIPEADRVYNADEVPTKTIIKNMIGHKMELAETVIKDVNGEIIQEDYAMLTTNSDKHIKLDAGVGPSMDRIIITDEKDNRIVIKTGDDGDEDPGWGPESITIECTGNMHLLTKTGEMDIRVGPESTSNITIQNEGTGDIVCQCDYGHTFVLSEKDIWVESTNIRAYARESVFVEADLDVNVVAHRDVNTSALQNTKIITEEGANITTKGNLNVLTTGTTNITSTQGDMNLKAPNININADQNVNITGSKINLN